jgi:hypothetical protein
LRRIRHIDVTEICFPLLPQFSPPPAPVLLNVPLKFLSYDSVSECSSTDHFPCVALLNSCVDTQYLTPLFFHHGRSRLPPPVRAHCSEPPPRPHTHHLPRIGRGPAAAGRAERRHLASMPGHRRSLRQSPPPLPGSPVGVTRLAEPPGDVPFRHAIVPELELRHQVRGDPPMLGPAASHFLEPLSSRQSPALEPRTTPVAPEHHCRHCPTELASPSTPAEPLPWSYRVFRIR